MPITAPHHRYGVMGAVKAADVAATTYTPLGYISLPTNLQADSDIYLPTIRKDFSHSTYLSLVLCRCSLLKQATTI